MDVATFRTLQEIVHIGPGACAIEYLEQVAVEASQRLDIDHLLIAAPSDVDPEMVRTRVAVRRGAVIEPVIYPLAGTPCAGVLEQRSSCAFGPGVAAQFPEDRLLAEMRIETYLGAPVLAPDGELCGLVSFLFERDVQERDGLMAVLEFLAARVGFELQREALAVEQRRRTEVQSSRDRVHALGALAGGLAHDVNNMLTAVLGHVEIARESLQPDAPAHESLTVIRDVAERAGQLMRDLVEYARPRTPAESEFGAVHDAVRCVERLLDHVGQRGIDVEVVCDARHDVVPLTPAQLQQIVLNLAINARDAMPGGGRIRIATATLPAVADDGGSTLLLSVEDQGFGIAAGDRGRVFDPFFTTKATRPATLAPGTGLGLAIVQSLVTAAGGRISFESRPGRTQFRVELPAVEPALQDAPRARRLEGRVATVLVVDDDDAVRDVVARALSMGGHRVVVAQNAAEGVRALEDPAVDAMVCDVAMPGDSGDAVLAVAAARRPGLPILVITGDTRGPAAERASKHPGVRLLSKPFRSEDLRAAVAALV